MNQEMLSPDIDPFSSLEVTPIGGDGAVLNPDLHILSEVVDLGDSVPLDVQGSDKHSCYGTCNPTPCPGCQPPPFAA